MKCLEIQDYKFSPCIQWVITENIKGNIFEIQKCNIYEKENNTGKEYVNTSQ